VSSAQGGSATEGARPRDPLRDAVGRVDFWAAVVTVELALVAGYFWFTPSGLTGLASTRFVVYPLLWINAAIYAVGRVELPSASRRKRVAVGAVAIGYLAALAWLGGLVRADPVGDPGVYLLSLGSPGWGPRVAVVTSVGYLQLIPYRVIGYPALAFLLYARLLDTGGAILRSAVGLVSCVSCSLPLFAALAGGGLGLGAGAGATLTTYAVDLSTAAYLLAVGLLLWRPGAIRDRLRSGGRTW
jgi:hypothetical protein